MRRFVAIVLLGLLLLLGACSRYSKIDKRTVAKRTLSIGNVRATFYPATHLNAELKDIIVLTDPILLKKKVLHRGKKGGLIAALNYYGYPVWLIHYEDYSRVDLARFGTVDIPRALTEIYKFSRERQYIIGGLSLGGQAAMHFVRHYAETGKPYEIDITKIFFYGTGFDYAYDESFLQVATKQRLQGRNLANTCTANPRNAICPYLKSAYRNIKGSKYLNILPKLERTPLKTWQFASNLQGPILFMHGIIDNIAPPEAGFPMYVQIGAAVNPDIVSTNIDKLFFEASQINTFRHDYDHYSLFLSPYADNEVFMYLINWLKDKRLG